VALSPVQDDSTGKVFKALPACTGENWIADADGRDNTDPAPQDAAVRGNNNTDILPPGYDGVSKTKEALS